jgi:hypothetical protein
VIAGGVPLRARRSRREEIQEFFLAHLRERFATSELHARFGVSFRTRVSELNRDPRCPIRIRNESSAGRDERGQPCERSVYWAELRAQLSSTGPAQSDYMRREREERTRTMPLFAGERA